MSNNDFADVTYYAFAHADDWQLFMNLNAFDDMTNAYSGVPSEINKVVMINLTAGDAGNPSPYWLAREAGAMSSVRLCLAPLGAIDESTQTVNMNGHRIYNWSANNVSYYFLRLPCGNDDGSGFETDNYESLAKLQSGAIAAMTAVDGSTTYESWEDLYSTMQSIIEAEMIGDNPWINYPNPDTTVNVDDHSDHTATGLAVQSMSITATLQQALFIDYAIINNPADLQGSNLFWKSAMFAAYEKGMYDGSGHSTLGETPDYIQWCLRSTDVSTIP